MGVQIPVILLRAADQVNHTVGRFLQFFVRVLRKAVGSRFDPFIGIRILEGRPVEALLRMCRIFRPVFKDIGRVYLPLLSCFPVPDHLRGRFEVMDAAAWLRARNLVMDCLPLIGKHLCPDQLCLLLPESAADPYVLQIDRSGSVLSVHSLSPHITLSHPAPVPLLPPDPEGQTAQCVSGQSEP